MKTLFSECFLKDFVFLSKLTFYTFFISFKVNTVSVPRLFDYISYFEKYQRFIHWLDVVHGISTLVGYLMPHHLYTCILNIYDLVGLGFMAYQPLVGYLMPHHLYTYILNIYDLVGLGFMAYQPL